MRVYITEVDEQLYQSKYNCCVPTHLITFQAVLSAHHYQVITIYHNIENKEWYGRLLPMLCSSIAAKTGVLFLCFAPVL